MVKILFAIWVPIVLIGLMLVVGVNVGSFPSLEPYENQIEDVNLCVCVGVLITTLMARWIERQ